MGKTSSPSESAEDPTSVRDAVVGPTGPRYGRPSDRFGPPTALFSPELALLKHDLDHLDALVPDEAGAALASSLIKTAAGFFDEEIDRQMPLRPVLTGLLTGRSQWLAEMAGRSANPEAVWFEGLFISKSRTSRGSEETRFCRVWFYTANSSATRRYRSPVSIPLC